MPCNMGHFYIHSVLLCLVLLSCEQVIKKTDSSCSYAPLQCSVCGLWDIHEDQELLHATCRQMNLSTIPSSLPNNLGLLVIDYNQIRSLSRKMLVGFPLLKELWLDSNGLEVIANETFTTQGLLEKLYLRHNDISTVNNAIFRGLKFLVRLSLTDNHISKLPTGTFSGMDFLVTLELGLNRISVIEEGALHGLKSLRTLILAGNRLTTISHITLGSLKSLSMLDIGFNAINTVDENSFMGVQSLRTLNLFGNKLKSIPTKAITRLLTLKKLDVSLNDLRFVSANSFLGLTRLRILNLNNANISALHNDSFYKLISLRVLHLNGNPLSCDCHLRWLKDWIKRFNSTELELKFAHETKCHFPPRLQGRPLEMVNASEFLCSCRMCVRDKACSGYNSTVCNCPRGWEGESCDLVCKASSRDMDSCTSAAGSCYCSSSAVTAVVCDKNARIQVSKGIESCRCNAGFYGNGTHCRDINECDSELRVCAEKAVCVNSVGWYKCSCSPGYTGDGHRFCADIDECRSTDVCGPNALCTNQPGNYSCTCAEDFTKIGASLPCYRVPAMPRNISVVVFNETSVLITWNPDQAANITAYSITYKEFGHGNIWKGGHPLPLSWTPARLSGLKPGYRYLMQITVISARGINSIPSRLVEFSVPEARTSTSSSGAETDRNNTLTAVLVTLSLALFAIFVTILVYCLRQRHAKKVETAYVLHYDKLNGRVNTIRMGRGNRASTASVVYGPPPQPQGMAGLEVLPEQEPVTTLTESPIFCDDWEIPRERLVIGEKIGEGYFGVVMKGELLRDEGSQTVAVKTVRMHADRFDRKDLLSELDMMKLIGHHKNIVNLIGACTTAGGPLYIITEYVAGGTLLEVLRKNRCAAESYVNTLITSQLSQADLVTIALDVAKGMQHVAANRYIHRDLAARNVLMTVDMRAKITDFGLARDIYCRGVYVKTTGGRLPMKWMSPEAIQDYAFSPASDVWSFGILLWEIMTFGAIPYPDISNNDLLHKILLGYRLPKPCYCQDELYHIMLDCWRADPGARPTFAKLCANLEGLIDLTYECIGNPCDQQRSPPHTPLESVL